MAQHFGIIDTDGDNAEVDHFHRGLMVIDAPHMAIHDGTTFVVAEGFQLNNTDVRNYLLTVPASTYPHTLLRVSLGLAGTLRLYEGSDRTGSNAKTVFNRYRSSANTTSVTVHEGVSDGTTDGTLIWGADLGAAGGFFGGGGGGTTRGDAEWILKPATKYQLVITSQTDSNNGFVEFDWYE